MVRRRSTACTTSVDHLVLATKPAGRYQEVFWPHDLPDEPVVFYSEINTGFGVCKVDVYRDGKHDHAD